MFSVEPVISGYPDISGTFTMGTEKGNNSNWGIWDSSGAFYRGEQISRDRMDYSNNWRTSYMGAFAANRSNGLYGNSNSVTPSSYTSQYLIRY